MLYHHSRLVDIEWNTLPANGYLWAERILHGRGALLQFRRGSVEHYRDQHLVKPVWDFRGPRSYGKPELGHSVSSMVLAAGSGSERKLSRADYTANVCQLPG